MSPSANASRPTPRWVGMGEWVVVIGLAGALIWTTLCLGGYLARTMVVTSWAVFAVSIGGLLVWARGGVSGERRANLAVLLAVPFLLYALASVLWVAPARWLAWREWLLWFQAWLVFALALHVGRNRAQTWVWVMALAGLGLTATAMAAYQRIADRSWMMLGRVQLEQFGGRSAGMFGIPNSLAALLELMIPVCAALLFSRTVRPVGKVICGWLALLFLATLVLTGSRGGWISLALAMLAWPVFSGGDWQRKASRVVMALALAVTAFGVLYRYHEPARVRLEPFVTGQFEASRPILWRAGWAMWQEAPWAGTGAASFNVLFDQHRPRGFIDEPGWAHNDHLNTLSDYGLIGFLLWLGGGVALLWLGARAVSRARRSPRVADPLQHWRWRLGLLLGLLAFSLHLGVDFHTKIPALAFAAAIAAGLLLRDEPALNKPVGRTVAWLATGAGAGLIALVAIRVAHPLYRAEAHRWEAREAIDRYARTQQGDLATIIPRSKAGLVRAVRIDPENAQAWSDLSYVTVLAWHNGGGDLVTLGRFAELAADEALQRSPLVAEFWVRKGVALSVQRGRAEAESCFRRALELAPNTASWWLYYAHHLQGFPDRKDDALTAVETCLTLDRSFPEAEALRQQLTRRR